MVIIVNGRAAGIHPDTILVEGLEDPRLFGQRVVEVELGSHYPRLYHSRSFEGSVSTQPLRLPAEGSGLELCSGKSRFFYGERGIAKRVFESRPSVPVDLW